MELSFRFSQIFILSIEKPRSSTWETNMKQKIYAKSLIMVLVLVIVNTMTIGASGKVPALPAGSTASLLEDCTPATGVVIQPIYASGYVACALGNFKGLPSSIGAITFKEGDPNTLLVATYSDSAPAMIYSVSVLRNADNHITGLNTSGTFFATAPYADAGLAYGPGNILFYSRWPVNEIGEIKPGNASTDKAIALSAFGVPSPVTGLNFVPAGFAQAGELKFFTPQTGDWYAAALSPEADGTYSIASVTKKATTQKYSRTFTYVPASSPQLADYSSMLVSEYYDGTINAYTLDSESNPVPTSRKAFLSGLSYVKGSTFDPLTNDLILAGPGTRVTAVRGFGTQPWVPTPTPTATATPEKTYMIMGYVKTSSGSPVGGVMLEIPGVSKVTTNSAGFYVFSQLSASRYSIYVSKSGYTIQPSLTMVTVPPDATQDFTAKKLFDYPPVVLVHGWLGLPGGYTDKCEYGVDNVDSNNLFDGIPQWLAKDGFDVWIAHWDSGPWWTAPLEVNGECLAKDIARIKTLTNSKKVILIAHSMGGPVSRAYLQSDAYKSRQDVETLITLGSPHAGIGGLETMAALPIIGQGLAAYCILQQAFCQMDPGYMELFNKRNENNPVNYYFTGGDGAGGYWLGSVLFPFNGPNDGLVGRASATGKYYGWFGNRTAVNHSVTRFQTREDHLREWGNWYFESIPNDSLSASYKCIREILLKINRVDCKTEPEAPGIIAQAEDTPSVLAPMQSGHISTGETITRPLSVDTTGQSSFTLTWRTQTLDLTLVDPNGLTIDPAYAMSNPSSMTFGSGPADNGMPGWMTYTFANTVPGAWTLKVNAPEAGPDGTDWTAITSFASDRSLEVVSNAEFYKIGDTATLTATLTNGTAGIPGATVSVELSRPDAVKDTLTLTDLGGGQYQGTYKIPDAPGYLGISAIAQGVDGGTAFSRQSSQLVSIMAQTGQLTGSYADRAVDEDGDRWADALNLDVGFNISQAGDYNLTGDILAGDQVVAQFSKVFTATAGSQTMTLRFDGSDIYTAGLDGPYLLTHLVLVDLKTGIPTIMQSDLYTTGAYSYSQFKPMSALYLPMTTR